MIALAQFERRADSAEWDCWSVGQMDLCDCLLAQLQTDGQVLREGDVVSLLTFAEHLFYREGTVLTLTAPITVCGDIHGQYFDLQILFDVGGLPPNTKYLFLGDYVDRGFYSTETLVLLLVYKVKFPDHVFMLRGNHECRSVSSSYGFHEEVMNRFGHAGVFNLSNDLFDSLPIGAVINERIFCIHGGLSPAVAAIEQLAVEDRRVELPPSGPLCDVCWSDPDADTAEWGLSARGAGFLFGKRPTDEFCYNNKLILIARAHQLAMEGYMYAFGERKLVTVWSAPNYMYRSGNYAAIMIVDEQLRWDFKQFPAARDPSQLAHSESELPPYFA
jgi:diadenosine tetraphosphatase ApaH/serine/threonine PP2A family protein phosphatase